MRNFCGVRFYINSNAHVLHFGGSLFNNTLAKGGLRQPESLDSHWLSQIFHP